MYSAVTRYLLKLTCCIRNRSILQIALLTTEYRPVKSQSEARGNIFVGPSPLPSQTFTRGPSGETFFKNFYLKSCILVYFIFLNDDGAAGGRGSLAPYPTLSTGPADYTSRHTLIVYAKRQSELQ